MPKLSQENHQLNFLTAEIFEIEDAELNSLLKQTYLHLGNLQGVLSLVPEKEIFLMPLLILESIKSSNIESINSTIFGQLQAEANPRKAFSSEQKQTENYKQALLAGFEYLLKSKKYDLGLILIVQQILEPDLGGIRDLQPLVIANTSTGKVIWRPPMGHQLIQDYLQNWLEYVNNYDQWDDLIKVGILHAQFEAIHPFLDGNGRTGRILILLYLIHKELLDYPCLYLSDYILKTRTYYYMHLQDGQTGGNYLEITKYLVHAISEKSQLTTNIIRNTLELKSICAKDILQQLPKICSERLVDYLFSNPFYSIESIGNYMEISRNTASKYLVLLNQQNFIQIKQSTYTKIYYNPSFLQLLS